MCSKEIDTGNSKIVISGTPIVGNNDKIIGGSGTIGLKNDNSQVYINKNTFGGTNIGGSVDISTSRGNLNLHGNHNNYSGISGGISFEKDGYNNKTTCHIDGSKNQINVGVKVDF